MPDGRQFSSPSSSQSLSPRALSCGEGSGGGALLGLFGPRLPRVHETARVAQRVRSALMRGCRARVPWQVSGKDSGGQPRRGHDHLYFVPLSSRAASSDSLDRVLVWARGGLEPDTLALLETVARQGASLSSAGGPRVRLELLSRGDRGALTGLGIDHLLGPSSIWRSVTAFVPPRVSKWRGGVLLDDPAGQLAWLADRVLGDQLGRAPLAVGPELLDARRWRRFQQRARGKRRPGSSGWSLTFSEPICGPVLLGHDSHFGLGLFEGVES